ncbi:hypothetical protein DOZ80_10345 [Pseudomonas fluorescens]|uniref:Peptidase M41 n=1 Tax=Pseudomonas fluorescens TaxID=294 RepID=A0A327N6H5_PSEFL|nr:hypothetical protein [Pseudomonas fluorescens]RAI70860.1 hypothetical protein DOZ80_10345 [Pseudomonas fluorescens]
MTQTGQNIPLHIRDRARTVAQHEMGHYVVAKVMGFTTDDVSIEIMEPNGHRGGAAVRLAQPLQSLDAVSNYLERRVLVLYAGALAETLHPSHVPKTGVDNEKAVEIIRGALGAEQDHAKAREAICLLRNILHPDTYEESEIQGQLDALDLRLWGRALELVEQFEATIVGVAGALTDGLKLKGPRVVYTASLTDDELEEIPALKSLPTLAP